MAELKLWFDPYSSASVMAQVFLRVPTGHCVKSQVQCILKPSSAGIFVLAIK